MNKINVLYKNAQFKDAVCDTEYNENYEFASEIALSGLLRKASISTTKLDKKSSRSSITEKTIIAPKNFSAHPKRINDESIVDIEKCDRVYDPSVIKCHNKHNNKLGETSENISIRKEKKHIESNIPIKVPLSPCRQFEEKMEISDPMQTMSECVNSNFSSQDEKSEMIKPESAGETARESVFCTKINSMLLKMNTLLHDIQLQFQSGVLPIESPDDFRKREKRSFEFSTRISRNYLYQLSRQIVDLCKHVRPASGRSSGGHLSVTQKFINAHQVVIQALLAFYHYIPQSIVTGVQNKFQELIQKILELCKLNKKFRKLNNIYTHYTVIEDVEKNCSNFLTNTPDMSNVNPSASLNYISPLKDPRSKSTVVNNVKSLNMMKKQTLENRLSMYAIPLKKMPKGSNILWKKSAVVLAKQRFNVQSRYKPGVYNPKPKETPVVRFPDKAVSPKRSSEIKTPTAVYNEDDVTTMVQITKDNNSSDNSLKEKSDSCVAAGDVKTKLEPLLENLLTDLTTSKSKDEFMDQSNCNGVLDKLKVILDQVHHMKTPLKEEQTNTFQKLPQTKKPETTKVITNKIHSKKHKSKITVTGAKNAQLICIKDKSCYEQDVIENKVDLHVVKTNKETKKVETNEEEKKVEIITEEMKCNSDRSDQRSEKSPFGQLSKKFAINIVQYKLDFHKFTKSDHMYRKTPLIQPWDLTSKISDKLLDKLLLSVISEIELNQIIEKVYRSEFV